MKKIFALLLIFSSSAFAQEPPYIYKQFGFTPAKMDSEKLSAAQEEELNSCIESAKKQAELNKQNAVMLSSIYGQDMSKNDHFGVVITSCLSDEKNGKGWSAQENQQGKWRQVTSRYVARTFMNLDPTK